MDMTALRNCGLLFLAGGAGALARYGVSELANTLVGRQYPLGTFVVNVLGCFLFGLIWELAAVRLLIPDTVRLIILVGFMGSFTTFSSLIFDSFALGQTRLALLLFNIGAQTILGFAALFLGMTVGNTGSPGPGQAARRLCLPCQARQEKRSLGAAASFPVCPGPVAVLGKGGPFAAGRGTSPSKSGTGPAPGIPAGEASRRRPLPVRRQRLHPGPVEGRHEKREA